MKQKQVKKLSLNKKAISQLNVAEMRQVQGGTRLISTYLTQYCVVPLATANCNPTAIATRNTTPISI